MTSRIMRHIAAPLTLEAKVTDGRAVLAARRTEISCALAPEVTCMIASM